jgi:hypothetical protein
MRYVGNLTCTKEIGNAYRIFFGKPERERQVWKVKAYIGILFVTSLNGLMWGVDWIYLVLDWTGRKSL